MTSWTMEVTDLVIGEEGPANSQEDASKVSVEGTPSQGVDWVEMAYLKSLELNKYNTSKSRKKSRTKPKGHSRTKKKARKTARKARKR